MRYPIFLALYKALEISLSLPVFILITALTEGIHLWPLLLYKSETKVETQDLSIQVSLHLDPRRINGCILWFYISILWDLYLHKTRNRSWPLLRVGGHTEGFSGPAGFQGGDTLGLRNISKRSKTQVIYVCLARSKSQAHRYCRGDCFAGRPLSSLGSQISNYSRR